ncbi:transporter substrate-binding domain-containing protein [Goodfellowiella coeruleoviolacea]|uniref:Polar amino acid transport system substrate-binding protein n=1 Tax=Goodfellowiella coeruleoviolacea TaxID=334858 RepID=A0AAE3KJ45_9PSEU|nr:transporter substrate-binding domain-containing protein [Goodfellowiella coeruleoviolacea]MCP2169896.1 polar amino acid transport system substrate-binding protein [Goodfellowiella coeruleoviolacea]
MARRTRHQVLALLPALTLAVTAAAACAEPINQGGGSASGSNGASVPLIQAGSLTTCTHLPYKPFQFAQDGKTVGFDVDLVDLVAKDLGVTQQIVDTPFEGIESGEDLNTNKCDLAAAAMTITDVRKKSMDFSEGYFDANQALLVKKGAGYDSLDKLRGKKLGVQLGTTGEKYATENKDKYGYEIVQFEDLGLEQTAVLTGQIDAGINDNSVNLDFVKSNPDVEVSAEFPTGEQYGIGVRKGNEQLRAKINEVLQKAKTDGTYDTIYEKWFGKKPESK